MKKLSFLALAAAGLLLGACSEKEAVESAQPNQYNMIQGQSAFIAVGIAMPGDPATRANEDLTDGDPKEYAVKNGIIVLFKGASEDEARLIKAYDINTTFEKEDEDNVPGKNTLGTEADGFGEVTSTSKKIIQEIDAPNLGVDDKLYAYVILNAGTLANIATSPTAVDFTEGTSFANFKKQQFKAIGIMNEAAGYGKMNEDLGLVMTNVPIALTPGGENASTGAVTTLAEIKKENIYTTREAAAATDAAMACIYVERAAVKVEVEVASGVTTLQLDTETTPIAFNVEGWALGNVNYGGSADAPGYYNTRQCEDAWLPYFNELAPDWSKYRFVGRTAFFDANHAKAYRTYFAKDVNYTRTIVAESAAAPSGLKGAQLQDADYKLSSGDIVYTYENTFDENSQIYSNTTYVGFKATIGDGSTFYTVDGQPNTRYTEASIETIISNHSIAQKQAQATLIDQAIEADLTLPAVPENAGDPVSTINSIARTADDAVKIFKVKYDLNVDGLTKTEKDTEDGSIGYTYKFVLANITAEDKDGNAITLSTDEVNAIKALAAEFLYNGKDASDNELPFESDAKVYEYTDGIAYYSVRIAHFGAGDKNYANPETPWDAPSEAYNDYAKIYPENGLSIHETPIKYGESRAAAWLGRWGIVRNNWYVLKITGVTGLGSPVPEDFSSNAEGTPGTTPDDNPKPKYYIAAHVHILPWVKRFQEVQF